MNYYVKKVREALASKTDLESIVANSAIAIARYNLFKYNITWIDVDPFVTTAVSVSRFEKHGFSSLRLVSRSRLFYDCSDYELEEKISGISKSIFNHIIYGLAEVFDKESAEIQSDLDLYSSCVRIFVYVNKIDHEHSKPTEITELWADVSCVYTFKMFIVRIK